MKKILFTGGGSAGHVTVNLALIPHFLNDGWTVDYMGSENGIERQLISSVKNVRYHSIAVGKLRRYWDWKNAKDPFKVVQGIVQAYSMLRQLKPDVLFSKGGFVSVPVVLGAWLNRVPIIIHESDVTPGLANRIAIPFASRVCTTFPDTAKHLKTGKSHYVGPVIREELMQGNAERGKDFCRFSGTKPVLLVMGGSLGARKINQTVREALDRLKPFQIVHLCGKGQLDESVHSSAYRQYEYVQDELPDLLAMADVVISRAGANSIFELLTLRKPMLLIPLPKEQSRGDQLVNAESFRKAGYCDVLPEEKLNVENLVNRVSQLYANRNVYVDRMNEFEPNDAVASIIEMIKRVAK